MQASEFWFGSHGGACGGTSCDNLHWDCQSVSQRSWACGRYKLTFVGAERMYVCMEPPSTTLAGDLMFIVQEVVEGNKLRPRFGRLECTSGKQMMCRAEPPTQKRGKSHSGKGRASWFAHAMRCSCGTIARIASLGLNCFLAGRSDACGVCVCGTTGLWT